MSKKKFFYFALIPILAYLFISFFIVKDYGIMIDDPEQFGVGHKNLNYYVTGKLDYKNDEPEIKDHPNFYNYIVKTRPHHVWPFTPMLSAATCKLFFEKLNCLPPIPAHHFIIPILTAMFFLLFFFFVRRWWGNLAGICAILLLMTLPRFFGHSLSNIKDLPEVLFFSLTIMYFMDWYLWNRSNPSTSLPTSPRLRRAGRTSGIQSFFSNIINKFKYQPKNKTFTSKTKNPAPLVLTSTRLHSISMSARHLRSDHSEGSTAKSKKGYQHTKYLYLSFLFFGLAFATKADAIFVIPILGLWLLPDLINGLIKNGSIKLRTLFHFCVGGLISFFFIFFTYPQLQPWYYKSNYDFLVQAPKFIYTLARYVIGIGGDIDSRWNLYSIKQIFYTTPVLILLFFTIGFLFLLTNLKQKKSSARPACPAKPWRSRERSRRVNLILLIWLLLPILRHCMPKVNHYDGLRHFMVFMVPFIIITTIGIINFAKFISKKLNLKQNITEIIFLIIVLIPNIYSVITLHPYQTTFYNKIIGGLGDAQKKDIPFSSDYWFNSNLELGQWINKNAKQNANIHGPFIDYYLNPSRCSQLHQGFAGQAGRTGDLKIINLDKKDEIPQNTYIVEIPRRWYRLDQKIPLISDLIPEIKNLEIVYQIKRQNGIIGTIYYKK
ncbi:MAG: hypothetical protein ABIA74_01475 [bacterium]